jgi:hypothetical protein
MQMHAVYVLFTAFFLAVRLGWRSVFSPASDIGILDIVKL